jgi:hypothetical protein
MKKVKITFYTSNIFVEEGSSAQDWFSVTQDVEDDVNFAQIAINVGNQLTDFNFIVSDSPNHFYRTSIITDFKISEIKEGDFKNDN